MKKIVMTLILLSVTAPAFAISNLALARSAAAGIIFREIQATYGGHVSVSFAHGQKPSLTESMTITVKATGRSGGKVFRCAGEFEVDTISGRITSQTPGFGAKFCQ